MAMHASWVQGNALTVESPENLIREGHFGFGASMRLKPNMGSWFHISIPTPVIVNNQRTILGRVFLLYATDFFGGGNIRHVHIYDGAVNIYEHNDMWLSGDHLTTLDVLNTFNLREPHEVLWGIGISFFFEGDRISIPRPSSRIVLASAGGDFFTP